MSARDGGKLKSLATHSVIVPTDRTDRAQELQHLSTHGGIGFERQLIKLQRQTLRRMVLRGGRVVKARAISNGRGPQAKRKATEPTVWV